MTTQIDIVEGSSITRDATGDRVERVALVTGVAGVAAIRIQAAIDDAGLPNIGDVHPSIPTIYLTNIRGEALDPETVRVTLTYTNEPGYPLALNVKKTVSATTTPQPTTKDATSPTPVDMFALYQTKTDFAQVPPVATKESFVANVETAMANIEFEWTIDDGLGTTPFPQSLINNNLGYVNSGVWNGYPARSVLCTSVSVYQQGLGYRVSVSFSYNPKLWEYNALIAVPLNQLESTYTDDPTLDYSTGVKNFHVYPETAFADTEFVL